MKGPHYDEMKSAVVVRGKLLTRLLTQGSINREKFTEDQRASETSDQDHTVSRTTIA